MLKDKISKEDFFKFIDGLKRNIEEDYLLYTLTDGSLTLTNFVERVTEPYYIILQNFFTEVELDYIMWYLCEYDEDSMGVYETDENGNEVEIANIVNNESLWEYLNREDIGEKVTPVKTNLNTHTVDEFLGEFLKGSK